MAEISYDRITPRARSGTSGFCNEVDLAQGSGTWMNPPERVAAVTVAVHIPEGESAEYAIEACCNLPDTIGSNGTGGYWDPIEWEYESYTIDTVKMIANAVTGIRVRCISANSTINVCFVA